MTKPRTQQGNHLWNIFRFYWKTADAVQKRSVVIGLILLTILSISVGTILVFESLQRGEFISALAARDSLRFQAALIKFIGILLLSAALLSLSAYVRDRLGLQWRKGLSQQVMKTYLTDRHYYHLPTDIDNPDQRITEDIRNISQLSVVVFATFLESGVQLIGWFCCKKFPKIESRYHQSSDYTATPKILLMKEICPMTSPFSVSWICPFRIIFMAS